MSKRAFKKIMQGIEEARTYLEGKADTKHYRVHTKRAPTRKHAARSKLLKNL